MGLICVVTELLKLPNKTYKYLKTTFFINLRVLEIFVLYNDNNLLSRMVRNKLLLKLNSAVHLMLTSTN